MKNLIYFIILLINFSVFAQRGGQGQRGGGQNLQGQQTQKKREFKASEVAGIFYYDVKKVVKKLKIKDDVAKDSVIKLLKNYNFEIKQIALLNADKFNDLNTVVKATMVSGTNNQNNQANNIRGGIRKKVQEIIRPIREEVRGKEKKLNDSLGELLTEKQNKKWLKFQEKIKEDLAPKRPQRNNNQGQNQRGNRQRRGF